MILEHLPMSERPGFMCSGLMLLGGDASAGGPRGLEPLHGLGLEDLRDPWHMSTCF